MRDFASAPLIALLTDFGLDDPYVGQMKAVLLRRCPEARLVDLGHGLPRGDVRLGALHLATSFRHFADGAVFLAVVDPGVGGPRRPAAARSGGYCFVGPDNGLLFPAATAAGTPRWATLDRRSLHARPVSATFHGRDVFAPVAAALAKGMHLDDVGTPLADPVELRFPAPRETDDGHVGEVLAVDRFGNAITNLTPDLLRGDVEIEIAGVRLRGLAGSYDAVKSGEPLALIGSQGYCEIAIRDGSAAEALGLSPGDAVVARLHAG